MVLPRPLLLSVAGASGKTTTVASKVIGGGAGVAVGVAVGVGAASEPV